MEVASMFMVFIWIFTGVNGNEKFVDEPWTPMAERFNEILKKVEENYGKKDLIDGIMIESLEYAISKDCKDGIIKEFDGPYSTAVPGVFSKLYVLSNPRDQVEEQMFWILPSVDCNRQNMVYEKNYDYPVQQENFSNLPPTPPTVLASIPQYESMTNPSTSPIKKDKTDTEGLKINTPKPPKSMPKYLVVENPGGETMIAVASPFKPSSPKVTQPEKIDKKETKPFPPVHPTSTGDQQGKSNQDNSDHNLPLRSSYINPDNQGYTNDPLHTTEKANDLSRGPEILPGIQFRPPTVPTASVSDYQPLSNSNLMSQRGTLNGNLNSSPPLQKMPNHAIQENIGGNEKLGVMGSPFMPASPPHTAGNYFPVDEKLKDYSSDQEKLYGTHLPTPIAPATSVPEYQEAQNYHDKIESNPHFRSHYGNVNSNSEGYRDYPLYSTGHSFPVKERNKDLSNDQNIPHGTPFPTISVPTTSIPEYQSVSNPNPMSQRDTMMESVDSKGSPPLQPMPKHIIVENPVGVQKLGLLSPFNRDSPKNTPPSTSNDKVANPVNKDSTTSPIRGYEGKQNPDETDNGYKHKSGPWGTPSDLSQSQPPYIPNDSYYDLPRTYSRPYDLDNNHGKSIPTTGYGIDNVLPKTGGNHEKPEYGHFLPSPPRYKFGSDLDKLPVIPSSITDGQKGQESQAAGNAPLTDKDGSFKKGPFGAKSTVNPKLGNTPLTDKGGSFKKGPFGQESSVNPRLLSNKESWNKDGSPGRTGEPNLKSPSSVVESPHHQPDRDRGKQTEHLGTHGKPNVHPPQHIPNPMSKHDSIKSEDISESLYDSESYETSSVEKNTGGTTQQPQHTQVNHDRDKTSPKPVQSPTSPKPLRPVLAKNDRFSQFIEMQHQKWEREAYEDARNGNGT